MPNDKDRDFGGGQERRRRSNKIEIGAKFGRLTASDNADGLVVTSKD